MGTGMTLDCMVLGYWINMNIPEWRKHSSKILEGITEYETLRKTYMAQAMEDRDPGHPYVIHTHHLRSADGAHLKERNKTLIEALNNKLDLITT